MNKKTVPFTKEQIMKIMETYPTPFHIYDEKAIIDNVRKLIKAFDWAYDFKEYFAVKATPNPYIMKLLKEDGVGADCSSLPELELCDKVGITGHDIVFLLTIRRMKNLSEPWNWEPSSTSMTFP